MPQKPRTFVLRIADPDLTVSDLTKSLSGLAAHIDSGRASITEGVIRNGKGLKIGSYKWEDPE